MRNKIANIFGYTGLACLALGGIPILIVSVGAITSVLIGRYGFFRDQLPWKLPDEAEYFIMHNGPPIIFLSVLPLILGSVLIAIAGSIQKAEGDEYQDRQETYELIRKSLITDGGRMRPNSVKKIHRRKNTHRLQ